MKAEISLADSLITSARALQKDGPAFSIPTSESKMNLVFTPVQTDFSVNPSSTDRIQSNGQVNQNTAGEIGYLFEGRHFLASYSGCDLTKLTDIAAMLEAFREATRASGATILNENHHVFPPHGLTAMLLLSESHASIHTYPEHAACFVDLFTCGDHCDARAFHKVMLSYLKPTDVQAKTMKRNTHFEELQANDHD